MATDDQAAPQPPAPEPPPVKAPSVPQSRTVGVVLTTLAMALVLGVGIVGLSYAGWWPFQGNLPKPEAVAQAGATENAFLQGVSATEDAYQRAVVNEWRAVRSDHKAIAYTVAQCFAKDIDTLSRSWFSGLLLDLHPSGDHYWSSNVTVEQRVIADAAGKPPLSDLSSYSRTVLFLSDAIGRARITAAAGADMNEPKMIVFSWVVVVVSAIGTLLVTLRTSLTDKGNWTSALTVGAILFSTVGTVLTSAKTFYDPAKAYTRNERALLELQKLHQDVMLNFVLNWDPGPGRCTVRPDAAKSQQAMLARWVGELKDQHEGLVLAAIGDIPLTVQRQADTFGQGAGGGAPPADGMPPANTADPTTAPVPAKSATK